MLILNFAEFSMADDTKACNLGDGCKNVTKRAKTPEQKKLPPEIDKEKRPKLSANGKSPSGCEEENRQIEMKTSDAHETEGNHDETKNSTKPAIDFSKGLKVEVKDLPTDTWYVAKVVDIEGSDVLIHYVNWATRHDEWITMDSNRIRAVSGSETPPTTIVTPVPPSRKRGRPVGVGIKVKSPSAVLVQSAPVEPPEVLEPKEDDVTYEVDEDVRAIWTDSRKYPAKIVQVLENGTYKVVFTDGFEKIMGSSKISKARPGDVAAAAPPPVMQELPIEDPDSKEGRRQRKRKIIVSELFRRKPSSSKSNNNQSDGSPAAVPAKKPKLEKIEKPEEPEVKISFPSIEPSVPKRGRGRPPRRSMDVINISARAEIKTEPDNDCDLDLDLLAPSRNEKKSLTLPAALKSETLAASKEVPHLPPVQLNVPEEPKDIFIGSLKIERDGDNLKCPKDGCGKLLRKEKLIMMHIKHYHPEMKEQMDVVPQVLDYAYARYVGDLPSTASMIRNFTNPASGANSANAAKKKAVKTPIKAVAEPVKVEEPPVVPSSASAATPSLTPRIQLGKAGSSKAAAKTGLKVKTLLPVRKSLPVKSIAEPKEKPEPRKCLEMPVLKKALMTPPMNSSTPVTHRPANFYKDEKPVKSSPLVFAKKSPRKSPRKDQLVDDGAMELINCVCGYTEEDGLIIQCDLCFCWQHGSCNLIDREEDVPDKFVCHVCRSPLKERKSKKYAHDQDWLKKGTLPRLPVLRLNEKFERSSLEKALKETQDIAAATLNLNEIMHNLKIQINIAEKKDHPKLYLWSKEWKESDDESEFKASTTVLPPPVVATPQEVAAAPVVKMDELGVVAPFEPIPSTSACGQTPVDDVDLHPALKLPLSAMEIEHLATTMAQSIPHTDSVIETVPSAPKAPEPEAAIKPGKCRVMLLKHIQRLQDKLEARITELESRNEALERRAPQIFGKEVSDSRVKETLRMLQRDVGSVYKIGNFAKKG